MEVPVIENTFTPDTTGQLSWVKYTVWKIKSTNQKSIPKIGLLL